MEEMLALMGQLQQQVAQSQAENQVLRERMANFEAVHSPSARGSGLQSEEVLAALRALPEALAKMSSSKPKGFFGPKGLGKPQVPGENAEEKFRLCGV